MDERWIKGKYLASEYGSLLPVEKDGHLYRGLAIRMIYPGSPKGRNKPTWTVTHLGSGHRVCLLKADETTALGLATKIAECGDWSFDGLRGYLNVEPQIREKFMAVAAEHPKQITVTASSVKSENVARQIAIARAG